MSQSTSVYYDLKYLKQKRIVPSLKIKRREPVAAFTKFPNRLITLELIH